ncbi:MAG: PLD nuclease N-terminal domain-containing protein [Nocardioidaceae bacterium]
MLKLEGLFGLVVLALWIFCVIDLIQTREGEVRSLPKIAWVFIVLLFPLVGSIAWLAAGRPQVGTPGGGSRARAGVADRFPEYDRPGRMAATTPDDDEDFLRQVRERAEEQRRRYREEKRRQQGEAPPEAGGTSEDPADPADG